MDLRNIIEKLSHDEKAELSRLLHQELNIPKIDSIRTAINKDQLVYCPHCNGTDLYRHGTHNGRPRYKCKTCKKTFNDLTGTAISGIKKVAKFQEYLNLVVESVSIRKAASMIGVNVKTIFDWRHKLLSSLEVMNGEQFSGIVECDDKQLDINNKGSRKLGRDPYKSPSDRKTKRGVSNDKVSIMVASYRKGNRTMQLAKVGRIDADSIEKTIVRLVSSENIICSDAHPTITSWAKKKQIEHHTFVASRQHIKDKCYHVQHVNSIDNLYERWIKKFYSLSSKDLRQYLNWFVFIEKVKKSSNQVHDLAKNIATNITTIEIYRNIENRYNELGIPHYSIT